MAATSRVRMRANEAGAPSAAHAVAGPRGAVADPHARPSQGAQAAPVIHVNGRFLAQRESGVQRFARQLVLAVDAELERRAGLHGRREQRWVLLVPPGAAPLPLTRVEARTVRAPAGRTGHAWDQWLRFHCRADDVLVNLANGGPLLRRRSISILHDAAVYRTPRNFTFRYALLHRWLGRTLALRSAIGTVSQFSRGELAQALRLDPADIFVVPNSCEHLRGAGCDGAVLRRLDLTPGRFFLAIGSPAPNKNLAAAVEAFAQLAAPDQRFIIAGAADPKVFGRGLAGVPPNVSLVGAVTDAQLVALLRAATALVFPSLYEGFGIPPLEAMLQRCPVLASDIAPVREVCGDAVLYFDPTDVDSLSRAMRRALDDPGLLERLAGRGEQRAALYSWKRSGQCLIQAAERVSGRSESAHDIDDTESQNTRVEPMRLKQRG